MFLLVEFCDNFSDFLRGILHHWFLEGSVVFLTSISVMPSLILSIMFIMTVVVPLSAFLIFISEFSLSCLIALRSDLGMLGLGFVISISERLIFVSSRYFSRVTDR